MIKKIMLGILLCGSVVIASEVADRNGIKCSGLFRDTEIYNSHIFRFADVDINDIDEVVDICDKSTLYALHILDKHKDSLSKKDIDSIHEEMSYFMLISYMVTGANEIKE